MSSSLKEARVSSGWREGGKEPSRQEVWPMQRPRKGDGTDPLVFTVIRHDPRAHRPRTEDYICHWIKIRKQFKKFIIYRYKKYTTYVLPILYNLLFI